MKKYFAAILSAALLFNLSATLSACNQVEAQEENNIENSIIFLLRLILIVRCEYVCRKT